MAHCRRAVGLSFAIFAAIRRASSFVSSLAADLRPGHVRRGRARQKQRLVSRQIRAAGSGGRAMPSPGEVHQLRQLGDIQRDPLRLILAEQLDCRSPGLLEIACSKPLRLDPHFGRWSANSNNCISFSIELSAAAGSATSTSPTCQYSTRCSHPGKRSSSKGRCSVSFSATIQSAAFRSVMVHRCGGRLAPRAAKPRSSRALTANGASEPTLLIPRSMARARDFAIQLNPACGTR